MFNPSDLTAIVRQEVREYVWDQDDSKAYLLENAAHQIYAVLVIPIDDPQQSLTIIVAQIANNQVIIETDLTDKPLLNALLDAGVPREQIVCAYMGEKASAR
ncbi:MAG: XisI protein [Anaerolineae bacterium]|nr:XisI protein [Anaerolineae bacterium]